MRKGRQLTKSTGEWRERQGSKEAGKQGKRRKTKNWTLYLELFESSGFGGDKDGQVMIGEGERMLVKESVRKQRKRRGGGWRQIVHMATQGYKVLTRDQ